MAEIHRIGLDEVARHFEELEDPRSTVNRRHPLVSVVVIALMAVLAGADGPTAIAKWAALKEEFLLEGSTCPTGFRARTSFVASWSSSSRPPFKPVLPTGCNRCVRRPRRPTGVTQPILAVDGKTARRSHDRGKGLGALHSVSVWASEFGLSLGQVACAEKSNEITAIPEVLKLVDIKGAIITIDAMGTQKAIAETIIDGEADYVLALKGNQETLHQAVIDHIDEQLDGDLRNAHEHVTDREGSWTSGDANLSPAPGPRGLAGVRAVEGAEVDRDRDVAVPS